MLKKIITKRNLLKATICRTLLPPRTYKNVASFQKLLPRTMLLSNSIVFVKNQLEEFDLSLQKASALGEEAIDDLLTLLEQHIAEVSEEYIKCLKKQMEIISEASDMGPVEEKWNELTESRILTEDMRQELQNLTTIVNTVGKMVELESMKYITEDNGQLQLIEKRMRDCQALLEVELFEIKKFEKILLDVHRKSILGAK